jgi:hypothetical protein
MPLLWLKFFFRTFELVGQAEASLLKGLPGAGFFLQAERG